uniref:Uncharacterized protein n=1 Tax=Romanomermis culicivorax TaxID=13658 RepID=A0A915KP74_ROMCU
MTKHVEITAGLSDPGPNQRWKMFSVFAELYFIAETDFVELYWLGIYSDSKRYLNDKALL